MTEHLNAQNQTYMYRVDHPDGTQYFYSHRYVNPSPVAGSSVDFRDEWPASPYPRWGLTRVEDRFGKEVLSVDYASDVATSPDAWRVVRVNLKQPTGTESIDYGWTTTTVAGVTWNVLDSLTFPAVGGSSLTVAFTYRAADSFQRNPYASSIGSCADPSTVSLPMLEEIRYRAGATVLASYGFTYSVGSSGTGALTDLRLPTGGTVSYTYGKTVGRPTCHFTGVGTATCPDPEKGVEPPLGGGTSPEETQDFGIDFTRHQFFLDQSLGVVARTESDPLKPGETSTTTYLRTQYGERYQGIPGQTGLDPERIVRRTTVTEQDGNGGTRVTKHLFAMGLGERFAASTSAGLEFQTRIYEDEVLDGTLVKSTINCYESDSLPQVCGIKTAGDLIGYFHVGPNPRQSRQVVWYAENPVNGAGGACANGPATPCYERVWDSWDSTAKRYERETTQIDPSHPGNPSAYLVSRNFLRREQVTDYGASIGGPFDSPTRYLPARVASESTKDWYSCPTGDPDFACGGLSCHIAPCETRTDYAYKGSLPAFVETVTQRRAESEGPGTIVTTRTVDSGTRGNAISVTVEGASNPLVTGTPFTTGRTYQNGEVLTTTRQGVAWRSFDVTRDLATGLVKKSSDPNGLETAYTFDVLGRLTAIDPPGSPSDPSPGEATTTICYVPFSGTTPVTPAYVVAKKGVPGACTTALDADPAEGTGTVEAFTYDGFGRLLREIRLLPNAQTTGSFYSVRETRYSDAGPKSFVSEWTPCAVGTGARDLKSCFTTATTTGTTLSSFDPYGRPRTIVAADGTTVTKSYTNPNSGITHSESDEFTYTSGVKVGEAPSTIVVAKRTDILGRVIAVTDPAVESVPLSQPPPLFDDIGAITSYEWNVLDKLGRVMQERSGVKQKRLFGYSSLGLLTSESHPEKGTSTVTLYDALGSALSRTDSGETYSSAYDAAGRLKSLSASGYTYLWNDYDGENASGSAYPKGRLTRQRSYHPESFENAEVQDVFSFDSVQGRPTKKATTVKRAGGATALAVEETYSWNALGLLAATGHARPAGQSQVESSFYKVAHPTRISFLGADRLTNATYGPSGNLASYTTGNSVTTTIDQAADLLPRPSRISTSGASSSFDTGAYSYDGAGNITGISNDGSFRYDVFGRLTGSSVSNLGVSHTDELEYDGFHNLISHRLKSGAGSETTYLFPADPATNRLSAGAGYDPHGNMTSFSHDSARWGPDYMSYDRLNRQTQWGKTQAVSTWTEEYLYDGTGERVVRVQAKQPVTLSPATLLEGSVGVAYSQQLRASGGEQPYSWSSTALPPGLALVPAGATCGLSGTPTKSGVFVFTVSVTGGPYAGSGTYTMTVLGPLRLYTLTPCRLLDTRGPNGPSGGPILEVNAGRVFPAAGVCGIPSHAKSLAANVTTVNVNGGSGWVQAYTAGLAAAPAATVSAFVPQRLVRATQAMVGVDGPTAGWFTLKNVPFQGQGGTSVHVIVDVAGYFAPENPASSRESGDTPIEGDAAALAATARPGSALSPLSTGGVWSFTFRNGAKKPTAEFENLALVKDSVYLGNLLVATAEHGATTTWKYYASDHLGTPRLVTNAAGTTLEVRKYRPFGLSLYVESPPARGYGFAGMEREASNVSTQSFFDHARQVSSWIGRFQAVDSANGRIDDPMSWNRYAYARNNPLKYVDRDGRQAGLAIDAEHFQLAAGRITLAEHEAHMAASVALNTRLTPYVLAGAALSVVGGLYVGLGGVGAEMMAALTPASASALQTGAGLISGPYGQVARQELLNLSAAGGSTTTLLTRLTSAPEAGRALSTAAGEGATALTNAARAGGTLYQASIPNALLQALEKAGLAVRSTTMMNGVKAVEYRFLPKATEFIVNFFEKAANQ